MVVILTDTSGGFNFIADGETLFVGERATLYDVGDTVRSPGLSDLTVQVEGTVLSQGAAAITFSGGDDHTVVIGSGGSAYSNDSFVCVFLQGTSNLVQNFGEVSGGGGVWGSGWSGGRIENGGTIAGRDFAGVKLFDGTGPNVILNDGVVTGAGGVVLENATATVINRDGGEIRSSTAVAAVDASTAGTGGFTLRNAGEIAGLGTAVAGSAGVDRILNSGTISGDVLLGGGNDLFNGRRGIVDGVLRGGDGNDTLLAGLGDDTLFGDAGADRLDGGAGDDLLTGGVNRDTFAFTRAGGDDVVADFQNGVDLLDLSAFRFASFAAVSALATNVAGGMLLDLPGDGATVFLRGFAKASFDATDVVL